LGKLERRLKPPDRAKAEEKEGVRNRVPSFGGLIASTAGSSELYSTGLSNIEAKRGGKKKREYPYQRDKKSIDHQPPNAGGPRIRFLRVVGGSLLRSGNGIEGGLEGRMGKSMGLKGGRKERFNPNQRGVYVRQREFVLFALGYWPRNRPSNL